MDAAGGALIGAMAGNAGRGAGPSQSLAPGAVGNRLLRQHHADVTLTQRLTMLRSAKDDDRVPAVMEPHMERSPTSAVGRISLYRCREWVKW